MTASIATDPSAIYSVGRTLVEGELWTQAGTTFSRSRYAVDGRWNLGQFNLKGQYSRGKNQQIDAIRSLMEVEWVYGYNEWTVYVQRKQFDLSNMPEAQTSVSVGVRFEPTNWLQVDVDALDDQKNMGRPKRQMIRAQLRFRWQ